jgi:hypothetical protein
MANVSSSYTFTFSTAKRIPTNTFDSILPSYKISTWHEEDAKVKPKRSSAEFAAAAKSAAGSTVESALIKVEQLKRVVDKTKAKRETDKEIKMVNRAKQKAIKAEKKAVK